ncbi:MAG TPA: hotdog fold thioesterase [Saprospiraceae bacterium]|nr:hotdog fold thioesterase [Saprospiraceae bacterium]
MNPTKAIWKQQASIDFLNSLSENTLGSHIGIEFIEIGDDYIMAKMPVDARTIQPFGILHGGASVVLAETLGSVASTLCLQDIDKQTAVGLEINANHLRSVRQGFVFGKATPVRIGRSVHVWNIEISDEAGNLTAVSRLTTMIKTL